MLLPPPDAWASALAQRVAFRRGSASSTQCNVLAAGGIALCEKEAYHGFCVRWFADLSDEALEQVAQFLMHMEELGMWPSSVRHSLLHRR